MPEKKGIRKAGRPRTGWVQIGLKLHPEQLAELDAWRGRQDDLPPRPAAIRRMLDIALAAAQSDAPHCATPALAIGDRVRSAKFGRGTIVSLSLAGPQPRYASPTVAVAWDAAEWGIIDVESDAVELIGTAAGR